jgi:hypothetical protein
MDEIVNNLTPHNGVIRSIFSFEPGFIDFAKVDMLIFGLPVVRLPVCPKNGRR